MDTPFPNKKYNIIYADPPWQYKKGKVTSNDRAPEKHYQTMPTTEIANLPVEQIADKDCILFMWATFPKLQDAFKVIQDWGFDYKTCGFVWVKKNKKQINSNFWGMGMWTRSNAEICLIATKGKPKRINANVHSIIEAPIREHSRKPSMVRSRIKQLMGDIPSIELFARQSSEGWDVWGNQVNKFNKDVDKTKVFNYGNKTFFK